MAPSEKMGVQDGRGSMFKQCVPTPVWFESWLHSPGSLWSSLFVGSGHSCYIISYNLQLPSQIIFLQMRHKDESLPILLHYLRSPPRFLSEDNPTKGFAVSQGESNPHFLPQPLTCVHYRDLISSHIMTGFCWAGPGWLENPLVLTSYMASVKFISQYFHVPLSNSLNIVFGSLLYLSLSRGLWVVWHVVHPWSVVFLSPGVYEVISEMVPIAWFN